MTIGNNDVTVRHATLAASREIKASANYDYPVNGITLDGSKFAVNELVLEGQCLARKVSTGKFEKYPGDEEGGAFAAGYDYPVILDESIQFRAKDDGNNPDVTAGQVLISGAVYNGMLLDVSDGFKAKTPMIRYE